MSTNVVEANQAVVTPGIEEQMPPSGLTFRTAKSLEDVLSAWRVLHNAYVHVGFITPNSFGIHTVPQAIGPHALVVLGQIQGLTVSTISAIGDNPLGLPVESVYPQEIAQLRGEGRKLLEVGLFGDRRSIDSDRNFNAVFELMRFTFYFGLQMGVTDFLCGIPPRRARLYGRAFGFVPFGPEKSYSTVNENPVVLMRADVPLYLKGRARTRAIDYWLNTPLPPDAFDDRFLFSPQQLAGTPLEAYLQSRRK
jgi:hypothetical protein